MKVLLLHHSLNSPGGGEKVCLTTVEALKEAGHDVVLATADKIDWGKVEKYFGKRFDVEERQLLPSWLLLPGSYKRIATFNSISLSREVDLSINMHGDVMFTPCDVTYVHIPTFALRNITNYYSESLLLRLYLAPYELVQKIFAKRYFERTIILTNSTYLQKIIRKFVGKRSTIVYPPVDVKKIFIPVNTERENIVVSCGRFSFEKRLSIIPEIARMCSSAEFYIMGSTGIKSNKILKQIELKIKNYNLSNIKIKTDPKNEEMIEVYSRAKIYLHTAIGEYFGISVVEGMASGLAPIVHKSGGAWTDIIEEGKYGLGYSTVNEAAKKINELLKVEEKTKKIRKIAQNRSKVFDKTKYKKKIVKIIEKFQ